MTTTSAPGAGLGRARVHVQRFGTFLSGMIMPNIAAFIAWGFITMLFISAGWLGGWHPVSDLLGGFGDAGQINWPGAMTALAQAEDGTTFQQYVGLVGPMITYLLPLLIANTAGRMVYGERGGVVATIATMGVIVGTSIPMFLGAMIMGPFAAYVTKWMDRIWEGRIKPGFEMLVNNFSAGILGMLLAILGFFVFGPLIIGLSAILGGAVGWLVSLQLLPIASVIVEPAKVLFLNNAINHGVFTPLGIEQVTEAGKSILFLIEANPGPGVGLLLAFTFFGVGQARSSAPGAAIIQFLGGIHEIYFPYALSKPATILALIAGGATGVATNMIFGGGLAFPAAPGSIIAVTAAASSPAAGGIGNLLIVYLSVVLAATVTFLITAVILRASRKRDLAAEAAGADTFGAAISQTQANKGKESSVLGSLGGATAGAATTAVATAPIRSIVFACDAGMGSSAMGASVLRNKIKSAGIDGITVTNAAIANLDGSADLVITQQQLTDRARAKSPGSMHLSVDNFMNSPKYDEVVQLVSAQAQAPAGAADAGAASAAATGSAGVLTLDRVRIHSGSATRDEALKEAADALVAAGAVTPAYLQAMHDREQSVSTFMGNGLAIPHGTNDAKDAVLGSALSVVRYDGGVDWDGDRATFVIGIAGKDGDHLQILSQIAELFSDEDDVARLNAAATPEELYELLSAVNRA
ncbi:PTS mannitol transporter subunit IICBA [Microbacterium sp. YJN-G]|uniref:PTS mannitol transporter subunit IICBA n=1 Tax=Microbacterium sp. YJN-G TaxID=2763257 RepID=UPI001877DF8B|nr:PTS mannitol transporter subunit IICBA [Microbacterium sp. YJN-G]